MKLALFSDVHANLPALEAVLMDVDRREDLDAVYHLGDLVGYAPWPNETVALVRARGIQGVAGNYDSTVATDYEHCGCKADTPQEENLRTKATSGPAFTFRPRRSVSWAGCLFGWISGLWVDTSPGRR